VGIGDCLETDLHIDRATEGDGGVTSLHCFVCGEEVVPHERHTRELPYSVQLQSWESLRKTLILFLVWVSASYAAVWGNGLVESSVQKKTPTHFWIGVVLEDAVILSHDGAILLEVYYSLEIGSDSDLLGDGESHEFRSSQKFPSGIPLCTLFGIGEVAIEKGDDCVPWVHITWRRRVFVRRRHRSNGRRRIPMS